jgi:tetratricopeptide (TPR) repeat protein
LIKQKGVVVQIISRGLALSAVLFLSACGTIGQSPGSGPAPIEEPDYTDVTKPETPAPPSQPTTPSQPVISAAQSLMNKADVAASSGDYEQAIALLERAQRIDSDNGEIYLAMAETYRAKGDVAMASAAAERGMLYCSGAKQCGALRGFVD